MSVLLTLPYHFSSSSSMTERSILLGLPFGLAVSPGCSMCITHQWGCFTFFAIVVPLLFISHSLVYLAQNIKCVTILVHVTKSLCKLVLVSLLNFLEDV